MLSPPEKANGPSPGAAAKSVVQVSGHHSLKPDSDSTQAPDTVGRGMSDAEFDWASDDSIAVREQPALAIYSNRYGQVVIRRERNWDEEDDCFIQISTENVLTIVAAILRAADMVDIKLYRQNGMACYDVDLPALPIRPAVAAINELEAERVATCHHSEDPSSPKDPTAAERQRRRRRKQRDTNRDSDRDTVTPERDAPQLRLVAAE